MSQADGISGQHRVHGGESSRRAVSTPSGRADARRNRARLLEAAQIEFRDHGAGMQIEDVAARAGIGVGTVYRNFANKDDLIAAVILEGIRSIRTVDEQIDPTLGPWEAFRTHMLEKAKRSYLNQAQTPLVRAHIEQYPEIAEELKQSWAVFERIVRRAQESGDLRTDIDHRELVDIVMRLAVAPVGVAIGPEEAEARMRRFVGIMLDGLRTPARVAADAQNPAPGSR